MSTKRAWIELNKQALINNYNYFKAVSKTKVCAILKGNFMGHGAREACMILSDIGCNDYGVATLDEAITIRHLNKEAHIMLLSPLDLADLDTAIKYQITLPIPSMEYFNAVCKLNIPQASFYLKLDLGMHRYGFKHEEIISLIPLIKQHSLNIHGLFAHLNMCDINQQIAIEYTQKQIAEFQFLIQFFLNNGLKFECNHLLSTNGIINYGNNHFDMCRIGMGLCGILNQASSSFSPIQLQPILSLKSHIMQIKTIAADDYIGYGILSKANSDMRIAIIPCGFADGYPRFLSNCGQVYLNNTYAPIIGNISMDSLIIDISNICAKENDVVELIGEHISAYDLAKLGNTTTVDLFTRLQSRIERIIV